MSTSKTVLEKLPSSLQDLPVYELKRSVVRKEFGIAPDDEGAAVTVAVQKFVTDDVVKRRGK